uniref:Predicted DNA binding protein, CopG/RHH family n=2 Tax=unclassified Candidatus Kentrum TaxID=2643149 RepID=A0A451B3E8_9GAMM|nr:MAG: Predicted DNA binding protein, CopG/RHH family [Candidatus Kentron sp. LPFa]VFK67511.1 MAG: Predicted DNA binding protein, CopG/RHH family [Candidatus Kentron sp. UNK]VFK72802.1 MAG: Predicted DNA binding protein, CopG/RHH family [Candidatus Kentron sp. UNK]
MHKEEIHIGFDAPFLDEEERMIVEAFDEFEPDSNLDERKTEWQQALRNTLRRKPVTLRLQEQDIRRMKSMAYKKGIPYQTLISSVVHQYAMEEYAMEEM